MRLNEYHAQALVTGRKPESHSESPATPLQEALVARALGLCGESGEYADLIKKHVFHKHELNKDKCLKELGDVLWYVAASADACGFTLQEVAEANIEKLRARYPNGFTFEDSINRQES